MFVELGTHKGYSFAAFCQAVSTLKIDTKCFAIDTWRGDEHAGFYNEDVYDDLRAHIDERYSSCARLIRSTFDDALGDFDDGTVDLLHIDGRHFFEDVSHNFASWKCKLAPNAVVLFHDINVRERGFGVYRLWEDVKDENRHFEFLHGHGLGVLGIGQSFSDTLEQFFKLSGTRAQEVREIYGRLGRSLSDHFEMRSIKCVLETVEAKVREIQFELLAASERAVAGQKREAAAQLVIDNAEERIAQLERELMMASERAIEGQRREAAAQLVINNAEERIAQLERELMMASERAIRR
jgi:hypothetical protein